MLLDTIAEAIWKEHAKQSAQAAATSWRDADPAVQEQFTNYARAALSAIAHPTHEMLVRGNRALQTWEHSEHYRSPVDGIYHAMIAAELPPAPEHRRSSIDEI